MNKRLRSKKKAGQHDSLSGINTTLKGDECFTKLSIDQATYEVQCCTKKERHIANLIYFTTINTANCKALLNRLRYANKC